MSGAQRESLGSFRDKSARDGTVMLRTSKMATGAATPKPLRVVAIPVAAPLVLRHRSGEAELLSVGELARSFGRDVEEAGDVREAQRGWVLGGHVDDRPTKGAIT